MMAKYATVMDSIKAMCPNRRVLSGLFICMSIILIPLGRKYPVSLSSALKVTSSVYVEYYIDL